MTNDIERFNKTVAAEALDTLRLLLMDEDATDSSRVAAAKVLLERMSPVEDEDAKRREAEERHDALAEARCLLAEFAFAKSAGFLEPPALDQNRAAESTDAVPDVPH